MGSEDRIRSSSAGLDGGKGGLDLKVRGSVFFFGSGWGPEGRTNKARALFVKGARKVVLGIKGLKVIKRSKVPSVV